MKRFVCFLMLAAAAASIPAFGIEIVPKPVSTVVSEGTVSVPRKVSFYAGDGELAPLVTAWLGLYSPVAWIDMVSAPERADVTLGLDPGLAEEEYSLVVSTGPDRIAINGGSAAGVWWGMQTLAQILLQSRHGSEFILPCMTVSDRPRFSYRGGMLDCSRHFFSVAEVKRFIDILTMHKLNRFHWTLSNDQGWRIPIDKYPKLIEVGSMRDKSAVEDYYDTHSGQPYGGFYTKDQIREIVEYAAVRQVTVIPDIDMPGHAQAALASYPQLGCRGEGYRSVSDVDYHENIFCAGNDSTLIFLKDVWDEVCELFPSEYVHVGGDEVWYRRWEQCPKCRAKMEELGYDDAARLHGYLLQNLEAHLNAKGRKIIGWNEIMDAGLTPTATVMSYDGSEGGSRAAGQGNDVIMTPDDYFYFDYYQTDDPHGKGEPMGIGDVILKRFGHGGRVPLSKVYSFDPYAGMDEAAKPHVIGMQANLWTEYVPEFNHAQLMFLPRASALAEDAWGSEKEDFTAFRQRVMDVMVPMYDALGLVYARYGFE